MSDGTRRDDDREQVARLFRTAAGGEHEDPARLLDGVPAAVAEARRRRAAAATLPSAVVPLGFRLLPAMGVVAAVLVAVAVSLGPAVDAGSTGVADGGVDRLLLVGSLEAGATDDVVLGALTFEVEDTGGDDE